MSGFWSAFIIVLVVGNVIGCLWLLLANRQRPVRDDGKPGTTGHVWDGDLQEYDNPLPRWWFGLFWVTVFFAAGYLAFYPGLGNFPGLSGWTQTGQYDQEVAAAEQRYADIYAGYADVPLADLSRDPDALRLGRNLFMNHCAACHSSDARGARGFPNLTDDDWLAGGAPEQIQATITNGRTGVMPALGAVLGDQLDDVVAYVRGLSSGQVASETGRQKFLQVGAACHGPAATGNQLLGAPNLTDEIWLHGSSPDDIRDVVTNGRVNRMPAQRDLLGEDRIRVLVAYVLSLAGS